MRVVCAGEKEPSGYAVAVSVNCREGRGGWVEICGRLTENYPL
jgi:hypothetical protein